MKRKLLIISTVLSLTLSVTSCGGSTSTNTDTSNTTSTEATQSSTDTITVTDVRGEVIIPKEPQRIVDLSGSSDMLELLGYDVIGTANSDAYDYTKFPPYLEETLDGSTILGYSMLAEMDIEAIIALQPDVIVISTVQEKMYDQLSKIAPVVMIELEGVDWKDDFEHVAETFHKEDIADAWLASYEQKATTIGQEVESKMGADTTYLSFLASGDSLYLFADAGLGTILYDDLDLEKPENMPEQENISLPVVTMEGLAEINADYFIVVATDEDKANLESNPIWSSLPQVQNGQFIILPASPYFNQGYSPIGSELLLDDVQTLIDGMN